MTFCYYQNESEKNNPAALPSKVLKTSEIAKVEVPSTGKGTEQGIRFNLHLKSDARVFELQAESRAARDAWVQHINAIIDEIDTKIEQKKTDFDSERERLDPT